MRWKQKALYYMLPPPVNGPISIFLFIILTFVWFGDQRLLYPIFDRIFSKDFFILNNVFRNRPKFVDRGTFSAVPRASKIDNSRLRSRDWETEVRSGFPRFHRAGLTRFSIEFRSLSLTSPSYLFIFFFFSFSSPSPLLLCSSWNATMRPFAVSNRVCSVVPLLVGRKWLKWKPGDVS